MAGVDAFALLLEELKSEEITDQLTAAKKISTIALGMGAEKSKSQLVPYLLQIIETHTDEVMDVTCGIGFSFSTAQHCVVYPHASGGFYSGLMECDVAGVACCRRIHPVANPSDRGWR